MFFSPLDRSFKLWEQTYLCLVYWMIILNQFSLISQETLCSYHNEHPPCPGDMQSHDDKFLYFTLTGRWGERGIRCAYVSVHVPCILYHLAVLEDEFLSKCGNCKFHLSHSFNWGSWGLFNHEDFQHKTPPSVATASQNLRLLVWTLSQI